MGSLENGNEAWEHRVQTCQPASGGGSLRQGRAEGKQMISTCQMRLRVVTHPAPGSISSEAQV